MTEEIRKEIKKEFDKLGESYFTDEIVRRDGVSNEMKELIKKSNILNGGSFSVKNLCDSIKIQKKVHNINPVILPKVVGNYNYNVHFKDYKGSEKDFIKEHPELSGSSGHTGVELEKFSNDLSNLLKSKGDDFALAFNDFIEHTGVGIAILSGYLYLFDPKNNPLINDAAIGGLELFIGKQSAPSLKKSAQLEKEKRNIKEPIKNPRFRKYLAYCNLLSEILEIDELKDFHYVDYFTYTINLKSKKDHYFAISFGEKDLSRWNDYLKNGYHAIG